MFNLDEVNYWDNTRAAKIKQNCQSVVDTMLLLRCSIRQCSEETLISKSTVHSYIHSYIRVYWPEQYQEIINILKYNSRYRRMSRKYWIS